MRGDLLVPKVSLKGFEPSTLGDNPPQKKIELRDRILKEIEQDLDDYRRKCSDKALALEVVFHVSEIKEQGSARDLDNMLKVLFDTLPDFIDGNKKVPGLGLIEDIHDNRIWQIDCTKKLVSEPADESIELTIFEWVHEKQAFALEDKVSRDMAFAKEKHRFQLRKDKKTEYWYHLKSVVENAKKLGLSNEEVLCAAWLHDTIEDTNTDFDDISEHFGIGVASIVAEVTKDKRLEEKTREQAYMAQLGSASLQAQAIKLCDIWANIEDIPTGYEKEARPKQAEKKIAYINAIRTGLIDNRDKIPQLDKTIDELNALLSLYGRSVSLS
jgi:hypothetical protein